MAKAKIALGGFLMALGTIAQAQNISPSVDVQTQAGPLSIQESADGFSRILVVGEARFFTDGLYQYVNVVDQKGSLYLVEISEGGTACPAGYVWLHTGDTPRLSDLLGNCFYMTEVLSDAETVTVVMAAGNPTDGRVGFVYDGRTISEVPLPQASAGIGRDPRDWIGRTPYEVFADADWRDELITLLGSGGYSRVGKVMERSSGFEQVGNWVVADGFYPFDDARAVMAMNIDDGQVIVSLRAGADVQKLWGDDGRDLPEAVLALIEFR